MAAGDTRAVIFLAALSLSPQSFTDACVTHLLDTSQLKSFS